MEGYINVFERRLDDLIKIMINERYSKGNGVLFLDFTKQENMDVFYVPIYDKENDCLNSVFPTEFLEYYQDKYKNCPSSLVYFHLFDEKEKLHIELDLDKKGGYTKSLIDKEKSSNKQQKNNDDSKTI